MTAPVTSSRPGQLMAAEIAEQPDVWQGLIAHARGASSEVAAAAKRIAAQRPRFVIFVARGSSDHAALYGKYLAEILLKLPCGLASPSTLTAYRARPDLRDVLMVGISQSGSSPDLVESLEAAHGCGALTIALTNRPDSPLDQAADLSVNIQAGPELAVAATKSYTAQLLTLYLLMDRINGGAGAETADLPDLANALLSKGREIADVAQRYRFAQRLVTTGRGYSYPTAREAALKLMETSYMSAQAFSGADLMHGPLAVIDPQVPVLAVVNSGIGGGAMQDVLRRLAEQDADVFCVGTPAAVAASTVGIELPAQVPEALSPLLEILPFQQLARHLAIARGGDPDSPRGLQKITETR